MFSHFDTIPDCDERMIDWAGFNVSTNTV